tara:strand:+ start:571 stop:1149 length:579 start_codon:yes stop_codon:yes gene_type:complete
MKPFVKKGWEYIPNIITRAEANKVKFDNYLGAVRDLGGIIPHDDPERGRVMTCYAPPSSAFIVKRLHPILERIVGEELIPTYWFCTTYWNKGFMARHTDRPSCEVSVTMNIDSIVDWPIQLQDLEGNRQKVVTPIGHGLAYSGIEVPHWRTPLKAKEGTKHMQSFFHYVRKNGKYADYAFDKNAKCYHLLTT